LTKWFWQVGFFPAYKVKGFVLHQKIKILKPQA